MRKDLLRLEVVGPARPARIIPINGKPKVKRAASRKAGRTAKKEIEVPLFYNEPIFRARKHDFF